MSFQLEGPVLEGRFVRLEPLDHRHVAGLAEAASQSRDSYGYTWVPVTEDEAAHYVEQQQARVAAGRLAPYAQVDMASGRVVGATSFWDPRCREDGSLYVIEIGFTWLAASAQGTGINTEAKYLLFRRGSAIFSITGAEWADCRRHLESKLDARWASGSATTVPGSIDSRRQREC